MAKSGCSAALYLGANKIAELNNISNPWNSDSLDATTFDSSCVREFIAGLVNGTIDGSGFYDPTDTNGQQAVFAALLARTLLTGAQKPKILWDGTNGLECDAIVTAFTTDATVDNLVNISFTLQCSGTPTLLP